MAYLLDANVFIQARRFHYGFDFCPAFWEWLVNGHAAGRVFSIEKVGDEIATGADELPDWAADRGGEFFLKPDPAIVPALAQVSGWVTTQSFGQTAVNTFLLAADYVLVAHALAHGHIVVTHEKLQVQRNKIQIPLACIGVGVKSMTPFEMLRAERARFVLGPSP